MPPSTRAPLSPSRPPVHDDIQRVLLDENELRAGVERLGGEITERYRGRDLLVVSVLKGSCIFCADLIRRIPLPLALGFVEAQSYGADSRPGDLELRFLPEAEDLAGRNVLLVDDILDTGRTLAALSESLGARGAADVAACVLLDKPARRRTPFEADFRGFRIDDDFVVGYGLDFAGRYRNLPYVGCLRPELLTVGTTR